MFEATAVEIRFKLSMNMSGQAFTLSIELLNQGGVVFLDELVQQCLLRAVSLVGGVTDGILATQQHADRAATARLLR